MQIDFSETSQVEDLRAVPAGEHHCVISEVRESTSPAGHVRWGLRWEVAEGDWKGRTACWDSLHFSERGLARAKYVLRVLGIASEGEVEVQPEQLTGKHALVTVVPEEREDPVTGIRRQIHRVPFTGYAPVPQPRARR